METHTLYRWTKALEPCGSTSGKGGCCFPLHKSQLERRLRFWSTSKTWRKSEVKGEGRRESFWGHISNTQPCFTGPSLAFRVDTEILSGEFPHSLFSGLLAFGWEEKGALIWNFMLFMPGSFVTAWRFYSPIKVLEAMFLWCPEAHLQAQGHLGRPGPAREGCSLLLVPRISVGLWEPRVEPGLLRAQVPHSDVLIPWFNLCLMPSWVSLKSVYLLHLCFFFFFFLTLTEREFMYVMDM